MTEDTLARACEDTAAAARDALSWIQDPRNDVRVAQERSFLERALRGCAFEVKRLQRSLDRPMCVGVFGPSQAGKSYLVSVLARKGETLTALFDDPARPEIDFISEINPYGEKEATGLVTRFTVGRMRTPAGFPVALRLLSQTDLLKILANSYFFDADQQEERQPAFEDLDEHIAGFEAKAARSPTPADGLTEEDVWDVEAYVKRHIRRTETKVFAPFWSRLARAAPGLGLADRAGLFSILWGRREPLTALYLTLTENLAKLDFAGEAFCPLEALVPAATGILNVETLAGLGQPGGDPLRLCTAGGRIVEAPRAVVAALAAELRIGMKETPWPFFEHTDLLDFPGYRGRTQHNLDKYLREAAGGALKELFLRGKVDFLFQRYTAEQELTSMLLCLRPGNLDVTTLPAVIEDWIGVTHGQTAEERRGRPALLFFVLTMFDQHLAEKAGDETADPGQRFRARMEASLLKPFAKTASAWPLAWTPGEPFRNCYWIRNPNYKAEGVIHYEGRREVRVHAHKQARIAELREAYGRAPEVNAHFREPLRAFDAVMRLNDGGVSYLAENLAMVCRPGMKREQAQARLQDLRRTLAQWLAPYFVTADLDGRLAERRTVAKRTAADLFGNCAARNMFGSFLQGLCLDRGTLAEALYESRMRGAADAPPPVSTVVGKDLEDWLTGPSDGPDGRPGPSPVRPALSSRNQRLVRTALEAWTRRLHACSEDGGFAARIGVSRESLKEVANELAAASRRLGLEARIAEALSRVAHTETAEKAAAKATIVAEKMVNSFVTSFGTAEPRPRAAFDAAGMCDAPADFAQTFAMVWLRAFYRSVEANAQSDDGLVHNAEQNARLGGILRRCGEVMSGEASR